MSQRRNPKLLLFHHFHPRSFYKKGAVLLTIPRHKILFFFHRRKPQGDLLYLFPVFSTLL